MQSTSGAGRPSRDAAIELVQRIRDVARSEFLDKGIDGASIEGIATAAGCSKLTIYRHFGSKEELFMQIVRSRTQDYTDQFASQINLQQPPELVLYEIGLVIASFFFKPDNLKFIRLVVAEIGRIPGLADIVRIEADRLREPVRYYLDQLKKAGKGRFEDPTIAAIQFINLCVLGHYYLLAGYSAAKVSVKQQKVLVRSAVELFVSTHFATAPD